MSIDRIGKGPSGVGGAGGVTGAPAAEGAGKAFSLDGPSDGGRVAPAASASLSPLQQLERGDIDVSRYLDLKVDAAVESIPGLSADELSTIRAALRDQLAEDPGLAALVRQATGAAPPVRDE